LMGMTRGQGRMERIVGKKIERNLLSHDPKHELSTRVRNALSDDGCELIPDAVANHFKSLGQLRSVPNLGKKSIDELQVWLQRHGKKPICE
jgi:DNA-directed RNA polymerase alpha subunit